MHLSVGAMLKNSVVDGPGLRTVVFLAGCSRIPKCVGCHNPHLWETDGGVIVDVEELVELCKEYFIGNTGLTISGGEPLDQYYSLIQFLHKMKERRAELLKNRIDVLKSDIMLYTGFTFSEIQKEFPKITSVPLVDYISDGPYDGSPKRHMYRFSQFTQKWELVSAYDNIENRKKFLQGLDK